MKSLAKKLGGLIVLFLISLSQFLYSQATDIHVFQEWAKNEGLTNHTYKARTIYDAYGHIYIIGGTISASGDYDWLLTKLDATSGAEIWSVSYDGGVGADDFGVDVITIGGTDDLFICGAMTVDTSEGFNLGIARVDTSGAIVWIDTYDNGQSYPLNNDVPSKLVYDYNGGYVCVTGMSQDAATLEDFITLQYDPGAGGPPLWAARYDRNSLQDGAGNIFYNGTNVVVTGMVQKTPFYHGIESIEYDASGSIVTATPPSAYDLDSITKINDMSIASNGDIYVAGYLDNPSTGRNAKVIKLDSLLTLRWQFNSSFTGNDEANSVAVDNNGAFYVGGYRTATTEKDFLFAKLDTAGSLIWGPLTYNGLINGDDELEAIALDNNDNPIVTGSSELDSLNLDYYTMRYDTSGTIIWSINYNGLANNNDVPTDISIDPFNNIFVIGLSQDSSGVNSQYVTVKYVEHELYNVPDVDTIPSSFEVIPNWGQLLNADTVTNVNTTVKFYNNSNAVFFEDSKLIHLFGSTDTSASTTDTLVRVDMLFTSDSTRRVFAQNRREWYSNFYYPHLIETKGLVRVPSYKKVVYPEIYRKIDLHVSANVKGIKEQFVLKQGSDPKDIAFIFSGADTVYIDNNDLVIATILDTIRYKRPLASQIDSSGNYVNLGWDPYFTISNDTVFFDSIQGYNLNLALVIEMNQGTGIYSVLGGGDNLEWSTFYGSYTADHIDDLLDIDKDQLGAIYVCGAGGGYDMPNQAGTYFNNFYSIGSKFAWYSKINPDLSVNYHTYYGGNNLDWAYSISVGKYITIVGETWSSDLENYSNLGLNYSSLSGTIDGFIAVFSLDGATILSDSYIGGEDIDVCTSVSENGEGSIAITGYTYDDTNFPIITSTGAYNQSYKGGREAFLINAEAIGGAIPSPWITFIGGSGTEVGLDVKISGNKIWLMGSTNTNTSTVSNAPCNPTINGTFCICNTSTLNPYNQDSIGGSNDMFIYEFIDQELNWGTYFGGVGAELSNSFFPNFRGGLAVKDDTNPDNIQIVVVGSVGGTSVTGIPYNTINTTSFSLQNNTNDTYGTIGKFVNHSLVWYTLFGGNGSSSYSETALLDVNISENDCIFVCGATTIENNQSPGDYCLTPTAGEYPLCNLTSNGYLETDYHPDNIANSSNAITRSIIAGFDKYGKIIWSTKFGNRDYNNLTGITTTIGNKLFVQGTASGGNSDDDPLLFNGYPYTFKDPGGNAYFEGTDTDAGTNGTIARFTLNGIISIENEYINDNSILLYPNPTENFINLQFNSNTNDEIMIQVFDISGRMIVQQSYGEFDTIMQLDVSSLSPALYFVRVIQGKSMFSGKFIKL